MDLVHNIPEIYLAFVIFTGLILVGTANFIPAAHLFTQKKQVTLSLYACARLSVLITIALYLFQSLSFLKTPAILFNGYSIVDLYTQALKCVILLTV
jgi:hypothetical protein